MRFSSIAPPRRRGFTLLEMLMVLGIIVLMAGLAWPALRGSMAKSRLRDSAQQLRVELARTRLMAMENGVPLEFRYRAGEGRFRIAARTVGANAADSALVAPPARGNMAAAPRYGSTDASSAVAAGEVTESNLPDGVVFAEPQISWLADGPAPAPEDEGTDTEDETLRAEGWSSAIVFLPDGTTSNATFSLRNGQGSQVVVQLRGLTGLAKPGAVEACDEEASEVSIEAPLKTALEADRRVVR